MAVAKSLPFPKTLSAASPQPATVRVRARHYPLLVRGGEVLITVEEPREVPLDPWVQTQINAGILVVE